MQGGKVQGGKVQGGKVQGGKDQGSPGDPGSGPGQPELEFWRVEAAPGQGMTPGVYELRRDAVTGTWTLRRN